MKKILLSVLAAAVLMCSFAGCVFNPYDDDFYYSYTYTYDQVAKDHVEYIFWEITDASCEFTGKVKDSRDIIYYINTEKNLFGEKIAVLNDVLNEGFLNGKYISEEKYDDVKPYMNQDAKITSEEADSIKDLCKDAYNNEILLFIFDSVNNRYDVVYLQMVEKKR